MHRKACPRCGEDKSAAEFSPNAGRPDGLQSYCRPCTRAYHKEWRDANLEHVRAAGRRSNHRQRHGIDGWETGVGTCDSCGVLSELSIDHDHSHCGPERSCAECQRGLLCRGCNVAIGWAGDSPERLRAAATYLERWASRGVRV